MLYLTRTLQLLTIVYLLSAIPARARQARQFLDKGWEQLVHDNDTEAFKNFSLAYEIATGQHNTAYMAQSLLYMGICTYGISYNNGLQYATAAMAAYKKMERDDAHEAATGRLKCLQLIATIYGRQGKYREAIELSRQVLAGFSSQPEDKEGYAGLAATSLGEAYKALNKPDSSEYYYRLALAERRRTGNYVYLPAACLNVAAIEMAGGHTAESYALYQQALHIADSTANRQAGVLASLGMGDWHRLSGDLQKAEASYRRALQLSAPLSDQLFRLRALKAMASLRKKQGDFEHALAFEDTIAQLKDSLNNWELSRITKSLEVQFRTREKERELNQAKQEQKITILTNYILWGAIGLIILFSSGVIFLLRRINQRDKQLLTTKETLIKAINAEKAQQEQLMQNEIEYKESQLSALVLQMQQKNELMQELKDRIEQDARTAHDTTLNKIINKGVNHDKEWNDFNTYFESINKNFYSKLKTEYPDISPNDLKICALIKLNMSIKEMAVILNISPDSVKTARYRLRKKLQLDTEDNLTDFILSL